MTFKLQAQAGSRRHSMWCGVAEQTGMPSPTERDEWGACTFILVPAILSIALGGPTGAIAAVIEGGQRHCNSEAYATPSDLSRSSTLSGQRSKRMSVIWTGVFRSAPHRGRERDMAYRPAAALLQTPPHYPRNHGNPCAEKVRPHRARQNNAPPLGRHGQGTLTITGSNVRLGTEMPVALSLFP
jgi:hypothetical protein